MTEAEFKLFWGKCDEILLKIKQYFQKREIIFDYNYLDYEAFLCQKKDYLLVHISERWKVDPKVKRKRKEINKFINAFDNAIKIEIIGIEENFNNKYKLFLDRDNLDGIYGLLRLIN